MTESRTTNVIKNTVAKLFQRFSSVLVRFIIRTVFIYYLGKEYTGVSGLFTDVLTVLSLMEAGLDTSMVYAMYKPLAEKNEKKVKALLNFYKKAFTLIGIIVLVFGCSLTPFLKYIVKDVPSIKEDIRLIFLFYVFTSAASYLFIYRTVLLNADQKSRIISKWTSLILIIECILEAGLVCYFRSFIIYLIIHFLATITSNIIISVITSKIYPQYFVNNNEVLGKEETNLIYRDILCLTAYNFSGVVINSMDSVFISAFIGTVEVAVIGNFTLIINSVRTIVSQVVEVTKPSIGNLAATSGTDHQEIVFTRMNFISFCAATFCCTCLFVLLNPFIGDIWLHDPTYKVSPSIVGIMTLNFYLAVMVFPVESFRTANGLFVQGWMRPIIMAILNIILNFILGSRWGVIGLFLATTISRCLTQMWFDPYLIYKQIFSKKPWGYFIDFVLKLSIATTICMFSYSVTNLLHFSNVYVLFIFKAFLSTLIPILVICTIFRNDETLKYILHLVKKRLLKKVI